MSERLQQMQARNIKNLMITGVALIVAWPIAWLLVPFGIIIGAVLAVLGVMTIVRSFSLKADLEREAQKSATEKKAG